MQNERVEGRKIPPLVRTKNSFREGKGHFLSENQLQVDLGGAVKAFFQGAIEVPVDREKTVVDLPVFNNWWILRLNPHHLKFWGHT
jgi:hypothetical protein